MNYFQDLAGDDSFANVGPGSPKRTTKNESVFLRYFRTN